MQHDDGFLVVANRSAGSVDDGPLGEALRVLRSAAPTELFELDEQATVDDAVAQRGARTLVAAGGDGTLHVAVAALRSAGALGDAPLGLVPLGTGNDFARTVGIPLDPEAAARFLVSRPARTLDLMDLHGEPAVNAVHIGLGVSAAKAASRLKPLGPLAYALGGVVAGVGAPPLEVKVTVDGEMVADGAVDMVAVCNGTTIGGGNPMCPDARPDDGRIDVVVVKAAGRLARLAFGRAMRRGAHPSLDAVEHLTGTRVTVERAEPTTVNVDGELLSLPPTFTVSAMAGAWSLAGGGPPTLSA